MRRYLVRPVASYDDPHPMLPHLTVYEPDDRPRPSGLLDQHGNKLVSVPERRSIGFIALKERE